MSKNYDNKGQIFLIVEQLLVLISNPSMVKKVKICLQFQANCLTMFYNIKYCHLDSLIHSIAKLQTVLSKKLYSDSLHVVDITFHFLYINQTHPIFSRHCFFTLVNC